MSKEIKILQQDNKLRCFVAIAVCHVDKPQWFRESIDSLLSQTYDFVDIFLYVDGAVDKELNDVIEEYEKRHLKRVVRSEVNRGLSYAMKHLADIAIELEYKYFCRMDSDDISMSNRISEQINFMESRLEVDVVGTGLVEVDEEGKQVGKRLVPQDHNTLFNALSRRCPINHPTVCIRVTALKQKATYNPIFKNTQDYFLWIEMAKNGAKFANLREPLLKFRRVDGFYKRRGKDKSWNELKARFTAMKELKQWSFFNVCYALLVFCLRMMPPAIIKFAYKMDRKYFHKRA